MVERVFQQPAELAVALTVSLMTILACGGGEAREAPSDVSSSSRFETVTFSSKDGLTISGRIFKGDGARGVVLAHMFPADQRSWETFAEELADQGYTALTFDFRGYGNSGGTKDIARIDLDIEGALDYLNGSGVDHVFLLGASMGGTASLNVAARRSVSGVITLSAPTSFRGQDARDAVVQVDEPKLFIAAEGDRSARDSLRYYDVNASASKESLLLSGNAHGTDILKGSEAQKAREAILAFLERQ